VADAEEEVVGAVARFRCEGWELCWWYVPEPCTPVAGGVRRGGVDSLGKGGS